jgi:hypothetical protein
MSKKSSTTPLLIAAGIAAAWWFFTRANALNSLVFIPKGVGIQGGGLNLVLGVQNPTGAGITLNSLVGSLQVDGSSVANITDFTPQVIAPNSETDINLYVSANVFGLAGGLINQLDGNEGAGSFRAALVGTANVNNIPVPVNLPFVS